MRNQYTLILAVLFALFSMQGVLSESGKSGKTGAPGEGTCVQCHSGSPLNSGGGYVIVDSPDMIFGQYQLGVTHTIQVTVGLPGSSLFGFSIVALDANGNSVGSFTAGADNHTEFFTIQGGARQYVTHNLNGGNTPDEHTFEFTWTAPTEQLGTVTFYATGLAANGNGLNAGDKVYSTTMVSPMMPVSDVHAVSSDAPQVNWNPAMESLVVSGFDFGKGLAMEVFDMSGKLVFQLHDSQNNIIPLKSMPHGIYLVKISGQGGIIEKKIWI